MVQINEILKEAEDLAAVRQVGVHSFESNGSTYWLKIAGEEKSNFVRNLSNLCFKIFQIDYLQNNASGMTPASRLEHEKRVIHYLNTKGAGVPEIVCEVDHYFVTNDVGVPLNRAPKEIFTAEFLERIFFGLLRIHEAGVAHGRPSVRDIIVDEKKDLSFVDFEESKMNPSAAMKARDFMLMILDLERLDLSEQAKQDAITYWLKIEKKDTSQKFKKLAIWLMIVRYLAKLILLFKPRNRLSRQIIQSASTLGAVYRKHAL